MHLTHLSLTNFRNFARLDIEVPRGSALIVGANGQGKTSLLEAIYFLATFTSFHASTDRELVNFLAAREPLAVARIVADFNRESADHRLEVRIIQEANGFNDSSRVRKEVLLDGVKNKIGEVVGRFNAVLFLPQMLSIIEGSPDERRRYLNLALAQVQPHYPDLLSHYGRALSQRNALLKQIGEFGGDPGQLTYWDDQLVTSGAQLIRARIQAVQELEHIAARVHHELTRGGEVLRLDYQPAYDPLPQPPGQYSLPLDAPVSRSGISLEEIRSGFLKELMAQRGEEIARGVTTIGPHRDELRFLESGIDLGTYGSRGEVRTAMLALKLAEATWMKARTGQAPVLLLDEVLAELDTNRRSDLLSRLTMSEQALLTTTDLNLFTAEFVQQATLWKVEAGRLDLSS
ncbi:MAG TPA: DNA replication/repair protein RecF [Anaerolineales bacterium]